MGRDGGADGSIDLFEIHIASLAAVRGNTQNQPEKSCYRSNFSLRLSRPIIRLGGECVGFRLILCVSSYCCLAQRQYPKSDMLLSVPAPFHARRPPKHKNKLQKFVLTW